MSEDITNEQRDIALKNASEHQVNLYSSPESGRKLREIAVENEIIDESTYTEFAITVGDMILGLISTLELSNKLVNDMGLPTERAVKITNEITALIKETKKTNGSDEISAHTDSQESDVVHASAQSDLLNKQS